MSKQMTPDEFFSPENGVLTRMEPQKQNLLMGEIVSLLLHSELHRGYRINDIGAVFLPPVHLNQFRIYRQNKRPIGFVSWAWLTKETEKKYVSGTYNLHPEDWKAGDQGWIIDFVAPFGHAAPIMQDLKSKIFPDKVGKAIRIDKNGDVKGILKLHGANRVQDADQQLDDLELPTIAKP